MNRHVSLLSCILPFVGLALLACGGSPQPASEPPPRTTIQPRTFAMGLSSLPSELTEESYASAFELAASAGEVILIRRTPPWQELLTDAPFPSDCTTENTQRETTLAEQHGLDFFVAIDVEFADGCAEDADLSAELRGDFADPRVREAFAQYAQYVAVNYQPAYLALGVDVNSFEEASAENLDQFVSLYEVAYDAVKELSPGTLVFPTFQLEQLAGSLPSEQPGRTQWHLISRFASRMDLLAVSSYPSLVYSSPEQIPADYFLQLTAYTDKPIIIADMGYSSGPASEGDVEQAEEQQAAFLRQALDDAQLLEMPLVVWFVGKDTTFTGEPPFDLLQHIGLVRQDGIRKPAWRLWESIALRPLAVPPEAALD